MKFQHGALSLGSALFIMTFCGFLSFQACWADAQIMESGDEVMRAFEIMGIRDAIPRQCLLAVDYVHIIFRYVGCSC